MTAALATLVFLAIIWMLAVVGAALFEKSGAKIVAALQGRSTAPALATRPVRLRHQRFQPVRARLSQRQRAAA